MDNTLFSAVKPLDFDSSDSKPKELIKLYHGSKGGIHGDIKPESRKTCDFGKAFYMGTNRSQAFSITTEYGNPTGYTCLLDTADLKMRRLEGAEWSLFILFNRKLLTKRDAPALYEQIKEFELAYDVFIGAIADDSLVKAFSTFYQGVLTFEGLNRCMEDLHIGEQYAVKTLKGCKAIQLSEPKLLRGNELSRLQDVASSYRMMGAELFERYVKQYRKEGMYIDEFLELYRGGLPDAFI